MSLEYRIYGNSGVGDSIDYTTPLDTTASLTWDSPPIGPDEDWRFAVRAYDTVSTLEDQNIDAIVRVVTDGSGADVTGRPNPPTNLAVVATANGTARASWTYNPGGQGGAPAYFEVYVDGIIDQSIPYSAGVATYAGLPIGPLSDGVAYVVGVESVNASGESILVTAPVTARASGPAAVEGLAASVVA